MVRRNLPLADLCSESCRYIPLHRLENSPLILCGWISVGEAIGFASIAVARPLVHFNRFHMDSKLISWFLSAGNSVSPTLESDFSPRRYCPNRPRNSY